MRVVDDDLLAEFRRSPRCEACGTKTPSGADPHHYFARGMGGGQRLDVRTNLVALCRLCHTQAHAGQIRRETILDIIARRERTPANKILETLYRLRRSTKWDSPSTPSKRTHP